MTKTELLEVGFKINSTLTPVYTYCVTCGRTTYHTWLTGPSEEIAVCEGCHTALSRRESLLERFR